MVKIVWISRHELNERNMKILKNVFGDELEIVWINETITKDDVPKIIEKYGKESKYVVVLPPSLTAEFLNYGVEVYVFDVLRILRGNCVDIVPVGIRKVKRIVVETEDLYHMNDLYGLLEKSGVSSDVIKVIHEKNEGTKKKIEEYLKRNIGRIEEIGDSEILKLL